MVHQLVDFPLGANVNTASWLIQEKHFGADLQPFRKDNLLLVAAGKGVDFQIQRSRPQLHGRNGLLRGGVFTGGLPPAAGRKFTHCGQRDIGNDGQRQNQSGGFAVVGQQRHAGFDGLPG